jgi:hypothetical protein
LNIPGVAVACGLVGMGALHEVAEIDGRSVSVGIMPNKIDELVLINLILEIPERLLQTRKFPSKVT